MVLVDPASNSPYLQEASLFDGGSGLVSSTRDYLTFAEMLLNGGSKGKTRIISRKSVELMSSNHLNKSITNDPKYPQGMGFGLAVGVVKRCWISWSIWFEWKIFLGWSGCNCILDRSSRRTSSCSYDPASKSMATKSRL